MAPIIDPPMPKYQCHKIVSALKIFDVVPTKDGAMLYPHDPEFAPIGVTEDWFQKRIPQPLSDTSQTAGYFVDYGDYTSWSPVDVFEAGYTLIEG